jgi:hypothetical protein
MVVVTLNKCFILELIKVLWHFHNLWYPSDQQQSTKIFGTPIQEEELVKLVQGLQFPTPLIAMRFWFTTLNPRPNDNMNSSNFNDYYPNLWQLRHNSFGSSNYIPILFRFCPLQIWHNLRYLKTFVNSKVT